jgi:hypothetical protein
MKWVLVKVVRRRINNLEVEFLQGGLSNVSNKWVKELVCSHIPP